MAAVLGASGGFHSRPILASVIVGHVLAGLALFQLFDRVRPPLLPPITVSLIAPAPPEEEAPPEPLPQAPEPPRPVRKEPEKVAQLPEPVRVPEPPVVQPEPAPRPEPPPPVRQVEPEPLPVPPIPAPTARIEQPLPTLPAPPEPMRPVPPPAPVAIAPPPPPVAVAPPPPPIEEPATQPLWGAGYVRNPDPVYPLMSRRMREQGEVVLRVFVTAQGDPREIQLKKGSGFARLDRAAQEAVHRWKFIPAKRGNRPVDAWVNVPINFRLEG